jgi:murein DD-endopeptidase MepM/ murein hydrolase activator NlpD
VYHAQSGDTLASVAGRFSLDLDDVHSDLHLDPTALLAPGLPLTLAGWRPQGSPAAMLLPDSEVVYSPSALDFDIASFLNESGGFLGQHREYLRSTGWTSAADVVGRVALEYSVNPRLLLALLEHECGCVTGQPPEGSDVEYLLGVPGYRVKGLYRQLEWAATRLSVGYYAWRSGGLIPLQSAGGIMSPPFPELNAGSVALMTYFADKYADQPDGSQRWQAAVDPETGLPALHARLFGDPWGRDAAKGPLLPAGLEQPRLNLPFEPGVLWSYTSGPHAAWGSEGALAALDFAPAVPISGCIQTDAWVVAVADGLVTRSAFGVVAQDIYLDASGAAQPVPIDGQEQTGWAVVYLHIADHGRVAQGTFLRAGERIGHPSCEGGRANGTHLHIARKYNGEWMPAGGPLPFVLGGWTAHAGDAPYQGTLIRDGLKVVAHPYGSYETRILVPTDAP